VARATLWLLAILVVGVTVMAVGLDGDGSDFDSTVIFLASLALVPLLLVLLYRWLSENLLWKVRNRLILTYLLMGLAPVVLFLSLAGIVGYLLAGQYATDTALTLVTQALYRARDQAGSAAYFDPNHRLPSSSTGSAAAATAEPGSVSLAELHGGMWLPLTPSPSSSSGAALFATPPPAWLHPGFQGIVEDDEHLYLCSEVSAPHHGGSIIVLASRPLDPPVIANLFRTLGEITFLQLKRSRKHIDNGANIEIDTADTSHPSAFVPITGGTLGHRKHIFDLPVAFGAPVSITSWQSGEAIPAAVTVRSRLSLLYAQLFATSVGFGTFIQWALIAIAALFTLIELIALLLASSLSRTITRSVDDLYEGTRAIDGGHLDHRIPVRRRDQLAALAASFNGMAASVASLLVQQREKERLLNELAIAQEVQTTLFPRSPASLGSLQMHGACIAARTVGGDYFDFVYGEGSAVGSVLLALGDISGKGISAALLMSALQSAVRAFSVSASDFDDLPPSPAILLKLLNEHLFRSTQAARYATLFLAVYDGDTGRLTYANAGHLSPLLVSADGSVRRLDVGGTVVGLLEFAAYDEATVQMRPGDLLVAFTDGLTEPEPEPERLLGDEPFGEDRLLEYVKGHRDEPLPELAAGLLNEVQLWIGQQEQPDDMTVVLARQH
jgi:sigma-B regulation protein RsbU (phosphoserine phosphatase)